MTHAPGKVIAVTVVVALVIAGAVFVLSRRVTITSNTNSQRTSTASNSKTTSDKTQGDAPLYFTTMTHMEGNFTDDTNEVLFNRHVTDMRWAMDLFDEYGVKLTFESEASFAKANSNWGVNILKEVIDQGHGVGTHADFGSGAGKTLSLSELTNDFKTNKALVDGLVGAKNNHGVSGGTGPTDWVLAASAAGFDYMDAVTGFGYLSMPMRVRPSGWTDEYIRTTTFHDPIPPELVDRLYPLLLKDATDLVPDADPAMVIMGGDIGELASIAEGRSNCFPDCAFDGSDVSQAESYIKEADQIRDHSQFARLNIHIPLNLLNQKNETTLRAFLSMLKSYHDKGTVQFATQLGSFEAYQAWNE